MDDNRFCVYVHCDENNSPFYVGSGTLRRANDIPTIGRKSTGRGRFYENKVLKINFKVKVLVLKSNMSKVESINLEQFLYDSLKPLLTNARRPTDSKQLDINLLSRHVFYSEDSRTFLKWNFNSRHTEFGKDAGCFNNGIISLGRVKYLISRVVCVLNGIDISQKVVDHLDGNRKNNCISNLRAVTSTINSRNRVTSSSNKTGLKGIFFCKQSQCWDALWSENGRGKIKRFPIRKFGDQAKALAYSYRLSKLLEIGGYTERHLGEFK